MYKRQDLGSERELGNAMFSSISSSRKSYFVSGKYPSGPLIVEQELNPKIRINSKKRIFIIVLIITFPTLYFLHISYQGLLKVIVTNF